MKDPILISSYKDIVRICYGHAKSHILPSLEIIEPSGFEEGSGFYPAQSVKISNIDALCKIRDALTEVISEYQAEREKCAKEF